MTKHNPSLSVSTNYHRGCRCDECRAWKSAAKTPGKSREPAPAQAKQDRPKGHRPPARNDDGPRSLAQIEADLVGHHQNITLTRESIAKLEQEITEAEAAIGILVGEARARIEEMARPFAGSAK